MSKASLIAVLATPPSTSGAELAALPDSVDWLEVRADRLSDISPDWLRNHFKGRLSYALRSQAEGGEFSDSQQQRDVRLKSAAQHYDRVELEGVRDLSSLLLAEIPAEKRCVAWHGSAEESSPLRARFDQLSSIPAAVYKLAIESNEISGELTSLALLKSLGRSDTIAFSNGPLGFWSRIVALHLGAPAVHGLVPNGVVIPSEPTITKLIDDYGLPALPPVKEIFAIIGNPIFHSLSPRLHNAAYRAKNYPALFLPFSVESFEKFWLEVVQSRVFDSLGLPFNGMTVASPHKEMALSSSKIASSMARQAESANILVRNNGSWNADTTDPDVVYMASRDRNVQVTHRRAAVIGCGGAGRAIAAALLRSGASVTLINRGVERGHYAAGVLGLPYIPLTDFNAEGYDIVVNATPVGRDNDEIPFRIENLNDEAAVIDLVYGAKPTPLVAETLARDQIAIDGHDVLVTQVLRQFQLMTGQEMPIRVALDSLR
jgi:3-dehydroquinate dehydratase / shikimate dehydrogenase